MGRKGQVEAPPPSLVESWKKKKQISWPQQCVRTMATYWGCSAVILGIISASFYVCYVVYRCSKPYHVAMVGLQINYATPVNTPELIAEMWFKAGGRVSECPTALAIAMASSQLQCDFGISYMMHDAGNADRGLFGLNTMMHSHVTDECAYDCECSVKAALDLKRKQKVGWNVFQRYTDKEYLPFLAMSTKPCIRALERLGKKQKLDPDMYK